MDITEILRAELFSTGIEAETKDEVLQAIARLAAECPVVANSGCTQQEIYTVLAEREKLGSTGFGNGLAIPHGAVGKLEEFVCGMAVCSEGAEFDSIDGQPVYLFVFILGPEGQRNAHIQLLSELSSVLETSSTVQELIQASTPEVLRESFLRHYTSPLKKQTKEKVFFQVVVQKEDLFQEILQACSGFAEGGLSVMEGNNASYYLNRMPLFTAFWREDKRDFHRVITAVVNKDVANDLVRKIDQLTKEGLEDTTGVLVIARELYLSAGSLDF